MPAQRERQVPATTTRWSDPIQNKIERFFVLEMSPKEIAHRLKLSPQQMDQLESRLHQVKEDYKQLVRDVNREAVLVRLLKCVKRSDWRYAKLRRQLQARETYLRETSQQSEDDGRKKKTVILDMRSELEQMRHEDRWTTELVTKFFLDQKGGKGSSGGSAETKSLIESLKLRPAVHAGDDDDDAYLLAAAQSDEDDEEDDDE